ncbi:hypothetical protein CEXT_722841 [Caerostris extrusa]|uniref:Uncharacterized protein n=1 Tax=Caerostris extrusa TaxID=172846 RepID=A0AAV4RFK9_CAEEX|nr:hypothetical protein CEXT_722841 [Caerostris extrusa]
MQSELIIVVRGILPCSGSSVRNASNIAFLNRFGWISNIIKEFFLGMVAFQNGLILKSASKSAKVVLEIRITVRKSLDWLMCSFELIHLLLQDAFCDTVPMWKMNRF